MQKDGAGSSNCIKIQYNVGAGQVLVTPTAPNHKRYEGANMATQDNTIQGKVGRKPTHGFSGRNRPKIYNVWKAMVNRCHCAGNTAYDKYGGRGIKVCDRWRDFLKFYEDMGDVPEGMTIDRIDVNGDYEPSNCRWASMRQQARNKRNTTFLTCFGETKSIQDWADQFGIKAKTVKKRLKSGWSAEDAINRPIMTISEVSALGHEGFNKKNPIELRSKESIRRKLRRELRESLNRARTH